MTLFTHKDGVWWNDAPLPPVRHQCFAQTRGLTARGLVERCACGAIRYSSGPWDSINSRTRPPEPRLPWTRRFVQALTRWID